MPNNDPVVVFCKECGTLLWTGDRSHNCDVEYVRKQRIRRNRQLGKIRSDRRKGTSWTLPINRYPYLQAKQKRPDE